jgi:hypothetical protein
VEHTQLHLALKKGTKISITLAILEEFLVISIFHETKNSNNRYEGPGFYSNFNKKNPKNMKSPSSMRNGRFNTSKCRGKLQKMGVLYTHSPKLPSPSSNFLIIPKK